MKYLICSDIHGSQTACQKVIDYFHKFSCNKIILLGDILYHGPRNPLPEGHNPKGVIEILNSLSDKIYSCRENCDAEVDQMVLNFSLLSDFVQIVDNDVQLFCTHGHVYAPLLQDGKIPSGCETASRKPVLEPPAVIFYGHTHVSVLEKNKEGIVVCNPGSISLPKGNTKAGFAIYENHDVKLYDMEGNVLKELEF